MFTPDPRDRENIPDPAWSCTPYETGEHVDNGLADARYDTLGNPDNEYESER